MSWKNSPFPQNKSFSFTDSFTLCSQKPLVFATKTSLVRSTFYCPQKPPFYVQKAFYLHKSFIAGFKNRQFSQTKSLSFAQTFLLPSKATFFCPPPPVCTTLNLLFVKNAAVLLLFAWTPCAVKPEPRTDSNHCRRYPEKCSFQHSRVLDDCRSLSLQKRIDRRFESSPESRGSQTSGVLLVLFVHAKSTKNVPFAGSSEVSQTSNQPTAAAASHRNN